MSLELLEFLYQQSLQNSEVCDVTLRVRDTTIRAHWCILINCPYFRNLHDSHMKEHTSGEIHLAVGTVYAVKKVIQFLYTGQVNVSLETVGDVLEVADYFQSSQLIKVCKDYIQELKLTDENCAHILQLCSRYDIDFYGEVFRYVCVRLPKVLKGDDLLELTQSSVLSLVTDSTLSYAPRVDFFNFIVRWTEHDKENRKKDFEEIFCALHLFLIPPAMFSTVENHPLVLESKKCRENCQVTKQKNLEKANSGCAYTQDVIILAEKTTLCSMYIFFVDEERWTKLNLSTILDTRSKPLLAIDEDRIMCVDKTLKRKRYCLFSYFLREKRWDRLYLKWPEGPTCALDIHSVFACGHRLLLVATRKYKSQKKANTSGSDEHQPDNKDLKTAHRIVQIMELQKDSGDLHFKCELFHHSGNFKIQAVCQQTTEGTTLDGGFICVMGTSVSSLNSEQTNQKKITTFVLYNIQSNSVEEEFNGEFCKQPLAFGLQKCLLASDFRTQNCHMFDKRQEKVVYKLQPSPPYSSRKKCSFMSLNHDVYIFGGWPTNSCEATHKAARFSLTEQKWTELDPLPSPVTSTAIARGRLPLDVLRCHWKCPHCVEIDKTKLADIFPSDKDDDAEEKQSTSDSSSGQDSVSDSSEGNYDTTSEEDRQ